MKRGQTTAFVVFGVVVVAVISLSLVLQMQKGQREDIVQEVSPIEAPIHNYVQSCLENTANKQIFVVGVQGGYANPKENSKVIDDMPITITDAPLSLEMVEQQLELAIDNKLGKCFDFSLFQNLKINALQSTTKATIREKDVIITTQVPLTINEGNKITKTNRAYNLEYPVNMKGILDVVTIITQQKEDIDVLKLLNEGFDVGISDNEDILVYSIIDKGAIISETPYTFIVGVKK